MPSPTATLSLIVAACLCTQAEKPPGAADRRGPQETVETLSGVYYLGDGFVGQTLEVHANGRFSFSWQADDGGYHRDEGTAEVVDGLLTLRVVKSETNRTPGRFPHARHLPARCGKRLYLVPEGDVLRFCNAVNLGLEPRESMFGRFYLRMVWTERVRAGEELPRLDSAAGLPGLPARWGSFLIKKPLQGQVTDVLDVGRATVDLGFEEGLKEGMELLVEDAKRGDQPALGRSCGLVKVVAVEAHRSTVELKRHEPFLKKGQRASSKIPKEIIDDESRSFFW